MPSFDQIFALGSASVVTNASGATVGEQRYYPFGETRLPTGSIFTDKLFTGQREMAGLGIYHYQARFYSPYINQFLSADTIVPTPTNPQSLNRYSYVTNNPLRYTDPTGHKACETIEECKETGITLSGRDYLDLNGYSVWERKLLRKLYNKGGRNARHGVQYILANDIHISVGTSGNWQSSGSIEGWYDRKNNMIFLNPNRGYNTTDMPSAWGLATIIHEAKHLEQGTPLTKYKELEAAQIGIEVAANLGYYGAPGQLPPPGRDADVYSG
jgi:RHS repeat-associated protein